MLTAALRDLQWRRRRFIIAVVGTAFVFAMTLVLTGLANGFRVEARNTVYSFGVDYFLIPAGAAGPFLGSSPFAQTEVPAAQRLPGVQAAAPLVYAGTTALDRGTPRTMNLFGAPTDGPGMPAMSDGRPPAGIDEVAVSSTLGSRIGDQLEIGSYTLKVVGIVNNSTVLARQPNLFLTPAGAQRMVYGGQPVISSIGVRGRPEHLPDRYRAVDRQGAIDDMMRPLKVAVDAISVMAVLLWVVAALIVGSIIYMTALERLRDFAVFKAVGVSTRSIMGGLALQAVIVAVAAAVLGELLSVALAPLFPMRVDVPATAFLALPALAVVIGMLASVAGLRRAVNVDPALAFGGP
ncbi:MAG TPA: ABC transporter permease [Mycobacterium sp.]|nr:ABC transporter permease [Mycobacterium sp.]